MHDKSTTESKSEPAVSNTGVEHDVRVSRRVVLGSVALSGVALGSVALGAAAAGSVGLLAGCGEDSEEPATTGNGGTTAGSGTGGTEVMPGSSDTWATGGTAAMTAAASYPDPFATASACALTCVLVKGPCWAPTAPVRLDVSEGEPGIPLRLALRVVEADGCTPVPGAEVEIWYTNIDGRYSAEDAESPAFCTGNDAHALSSHFFRGRAISDADGKLQFHGCFPGWYPSRSIHIHVLVRPAANAGESTTSNAIAMSQLFFPEALTAEIFDGVAGYVDKGQPDTRFANDGVLRSVADIAPYVLEYERMSDGAMLAWKTIAISSTESCG